METKSVKRKLTLGAGTTVLEGYSNPFTIHSMTKMLNARSSIMMVTLPVLGISHSTRPNATTFSSTSLDLFG